MTQLKASSRWWLRCNCVCARVRVCDGFCCCCFESAMDEYSQVCGMLCCKMDERLQYCYKTQTVALHTRLIRSSSWCLWLDEVVSKLQKLSAVKEIHLVKKKIFFFFFFFSNHDGAISNLSVKPKKIWEIKTGMDMFRPEAQFSQIEDEKLEIWYMHI